MMQTYSLKQAAAILGINRNTLADWLAKGCPAVTRADRARGVEWELSVSAIFEWRNDYVVREAVASYRTEDGHITKDEADRRRALAMAIIAEVDADTAIRNVVTVADVEETNAAFCQALKSGLDNAANKVAGRAATMTAPEEIRELCHHELNRSFRTAKEELRRRWGLLKDSGASDPESDDPDEE